MTDYTWPSNVYPASQSLSWIDNTVVFRSPISGQVRTLERSGGHWNMMMTLNGWMNVPSPNMPSVHTLESFLFKLNGAANRAVIPDFGYQRLSTATGTILVGGSNQTGFSLITYGWPTSQLVMYAGERIGVSNQMIPLAADATTDSNGFVTLQLAHPILVAPVNATEIEIDNPTAKYYLKNKAGLTTKPGFVKAFMVEFEEAIP